MILNWKGSDATANLKDLANVYADVTKFLKDTQKFVVYVNNDEILPIQRHIGASGGTCAVGNELGFTLTADDTIAVPETTELWADNKIIENAVTFNNFPDSFQIFIDEIVTAKNALLANWLDGANRAEVVELFNKFEQNAPDHKSNIKKVRDNLNTVAENKKQFL